MNTIPQNTSILLSGTALSRPLKPLMWVSATQLNRSVTPPVYLWTHNFTEDRRALLHKDPESASPKRPTVRKHGVEKAATNETRDQPNRKGNKRRGKNVSPTRERTRRTKSRDRVAGGESITGHEGEGDTKREVLVSVNRNSPDPDRGSNPIEHREKHHTSVKNDSDGVRNSEALHRSLPMKQYSLYLPSGSAQQLNLNFPPEKSSPALRRSMSTKIALSRPFNVDENLGDQEYGDWVPRKLRVELGRFSSEKPKFGYDKLNESDIVSGIAPEPDEHPPPINKSPRNCWDVELDHSTPSAPISKYASTPKAFKSKKKVEFEPAFHRHGGSVFSDVNFDGLSLRPRITTVSESLYPFPPPNFILAASPSVPHTQTTDTLVIGTGKPLSAEKLEKHITQLQKKIESEKKKRALSPVASQKSSSPKLGRSVPESIFDAVSVDDEIVVPYSSFKNVHDRNMETEVPTDVSGSRKLADLVLVRKEKSMTRSSTGVTRSAKASSEKELRKKIVIPGSSMVRPHSSPSAGRSSRRPRSSSSSKSRKKERRLSDPKTPTKCAISEEELLAKTIIIQRWTRMRFARRKYLEILRAVPIIQDFWRKYTSYMPAEFR